MSSNSNHIISLDNYEEYFILYLDGELDSVQMEAVDAFVANYPHLKAELELLLQTKLPMEEMVFDKASLMAEQMKLATIEEDLLSYVDDELVPEKKRKVELELALNPAYKKEYEQLMMARLDPADTIACPRKEALYRRGAAIRPLYFRMSAAAAIILLAFMGSMYLTRERITIPSDQAVASGNSTQAPLPVVEGGSDATEHSTPAITKAVETAGTVTEKAMASVASTRTKEQKFDRAATPEVAPVEPEPVALSSNAIAYQPVNKISGMGMEPAEDLSLPVTAKFNHTAAVTSTAEVRNTDNDAVAGNTDVADNRKGVLKGLFRKATRVLAKTTGLDKTTDEDEVLIGAVAVKVK